MTRILSIDLGVTGAWAIWRDGEPIALNDLKTDEVGRIDVRPLAAVAAVCEAVVIEKVHAMPTGSKANFSMGRHSGAIAAMASLTGATLYEIRPTAWKKQIGFTTKGKDQKGEALEIARAKWPTFAGRLERMKDNHRADALLIGQAWLEGVR